ncbi:hypothetical protein, partial [Xanthovirga aplysinae]|uniref:hypothetical protein n=1 Tax=Xanthovirga aplysinae TaxID=2529853 RepID=UPI0012BC3ED3
MKLKLANLLIILFGISSCNQKGETIDEIDGEWNSIGYGQQMIIEDDTATIFDTYNGGCVLRMKLPKTFIDNYY